RAPDEPATVRPPRPHGIRTGLAVPGGAALHPAHGVFLGGPGDIEAGGLPAGRAEDGAHLLVRCWSGGAGGTADRVPRGGSRPRLRDHHGAAAAADALRAGGGRAPARLDAAPSGDRRLVARGGAGRATAHVRRFRRGTRAVSGGGAELCRLSDLAEAAGPGGGRDVLAPESGGVLRADCARGARGEGGGAGCTTAGSRAARGDEHGAARGGTAAAADSEHPRARRLGAPVGAGERPGRRGLRCHGGGPAGGSPRCRVDRRAVSEHVAVARGGGAGAPAARLARRAPGTSGGDAPPRACAARRRAALERAPSG